MESQKSQDTYCILSCTVNPSWNRASRSSNAVRDARCEMRVASCEMLIVHVYVYVHFLPSLATPPDTLLTIRTLIHTVPVSPACQASRDLLETTPTTSPFVPEEVTEYG